MRRPTPVNLPALAAALVTSMLLLGCGATSGSSGSTPASSPASPGMSAGSSSPAPPPGSGPGSGSGSSAATQFLYALEKNNSIERFSIAAATGALTSEGLTTDSTSDRLGDIAVDPKSQYIFKGVSAPSSNFGLGSYVSSYAIGSNGALTESDRQKLPNNCDTIASLAVDPSGTNLYVSCYQAMTVGYISVYAIDRATGHLANSAPDASVGVGGKLVVNPAGTYVYMARHPMHHYPPYAGNTGWGIFARDPAAGSLTAVGGVGSSTEVYEYSDGTIVLGGKYLIATQGNVYSTFALNAGAATEMNSVAAGAVGIAADPSGNFIVMSAYHSDAVQSFRVNSDGSLAPIAMQNAGAGASSITFDRSGKYVYVENTQTSQVFAFTFDTATGALGQVAGSPFATSAVPVNVVAAGH